MAIASILYSSPAKPTRLKKKISKKRSQSNGGVKVLITTAFAYTNVHIFTRLPEWTLFKIHLESHIQLIYFLYCLSVTLFFRSLFPLYCSFSLNDGHETNELNETHGAFFLFFNCCFLKTVYSFLLIIVVFFFTKSSFSVFDRFTGKMK